MLILIWKIYYFYARYGLKEEDALRTYNATSAIYKRVVKQVSSKLEFFRLLDMDTWMY